VKIYFCGAHNKGREEYQ